MTRVLVVCDIRLYREGLVDALARSGLAATATPATDGTDPRDELRKHAPDVVLLDLAHPRARAVLDAAGPATRVLALGVRELEDEVISWAEAGVAGYVTREATLEELVAAVAGVARGDVVCSPRISALLLRRGAAAADAHRKPARDGRLTRRENEIATLLDEGLSNKQIALRLSIEPTTVKNHVHSILDKLGVARRGDAAAQLRRDGRNGRGGD